MLESYSVLTRLPAGLAVPADIAARVLEDRFNEGPLRLPANRRRAVLATLSGAGVLGGASYDGVIALEAAAHGETLLTLDARAVATYQRLGAVVPRDLGLSRVPAPAAARLRRDGRASLRVRCPSRAVPGRAGPLRGVRRAAAARLARRSRRAVRARAARPSRRTARRCARAATSRRARGRRDRAAAPGRPSSSRATRRTRSPDFLLVATPGAGKTLAACQAIRARGREQVVVVCPTTALRAQWADAADRVGLHLDPRWRNADGAWRDDVDGVVVTYQQVASAPDLFAHHLARPTFVVLDEIHHAGESATWGTALRAAFDGARAPPRAVRHAVPLRRARDPVRALRRRAPLRARLRLRLRRGGRATTSAARSRSGCSTRRCAGASTRRRRSRPSPTSSSRPTTRAACAPRSTRARRCCRRCCATPTRCSLKARAVIPDAAGLVLCDDRAHARATAALLRTIAGEKPVVVVSDEPQAHTPDRPLRPRRRGRARAGSSPSTWSARASTSRGSSSPPTRPSSAPTCSSARPSAASSGAARGDPDDLVATVFLPADPTLTGCAERVEVELRQQVSDDVGAAFDVEPPPGLARRPDFQPLDAQVEPGGMIVAGVHYARVEVDAARRLLRELGQSERALRSVLEFVRRERVGRPPRRRSARAGARPPPRRAQAPRARPPRAPLGAAAARDRPRLHLAAGAGARQPRDGRPPPRRRGRGRSSTTAWPSCARARQARDATRSRPSGCASRRASRRSTSGSAPAPARSSAAPDRPAGDRIGRRVGHAGDVRHDLVVLGGIAAAQVPVLAGRIGAHDHAPSR